MKSKKIGVGVVYRPPSVSINCIDEIFEPLEITYLETQSIILMGDININLLDSNSHSASRFNSVINGFNLVQIVNKPTRITETSESLIDIICVSKDLKMYKSDTRDVLCNTDHMLVSCSLSLNVDMMIPKCVYYRDFRNFDMDAFACDATSVDWNSVNELADVNLKTECLNNIILSLFDSHAPLKVVNFKRPYQPHITYNIKEIIKLKKKAYNKYLRERSITSRKYYVDLRNYLKTAIKKEKDAYIKYVLNASKNNNKMLWNNLRKCGLASKQCSNNKLPDDLSDPDAINNYFLNITNHSNISADILNYYRNNKLNTNNVFSISPVTESDIYSSLRSIKSASYGFDNININMINIVIPYCINVVKNIFSSSISSGISPSIWKTANIVPIPKKSCPSTFSDLRP